MKEKYHTTYFVYISVKKNSFIVESKLSGHDTYVNADISQ